MKKLVSVVLVLLLIVSCVVTASAIKSRNDKYNIISIFNCVKSEIEYYNALIEKDEFPIEVYGVYMNLLTSMLDIADSYCYEKLLAELGDIDAAWRKYDQYALGSVGDKTQTFMSLSDKVSSCRKKYTGLVLDNSVASSDKEKIGNLYSYSIATIDTLAFIK